jgi:hypothetical protein
VKLPVQAPAVVRRDFSWPTQRLVYDGGAEAAIGPASGSVVNCTGTTPFACVCDNGIATCCSTSAGCTNDPNTGACNCLSK